MPGLDESRGPGPSVLFERNPRVILRSGAFGDTTASGLRPRVRPRRAGGGCTIVHSSLYIYIAPAPPPSPRLPACGAPSSSGACSTPRTIRRAQVCWSDVPLLVRARPIPCGLFLWLRRTTPKTAVRPRGLSAQARTMVTR
jgi:hypothetical protein